MRKSSSHNLFALLLLACVLALAAGCAPRYDHPVAGTPTDPTYSGAKNDSTEMKSVRTTNPYGRGDYGRTSGRSETGQPPRRSEVFCDQQWSSCMNKCNDISNVQIRLNCLDECDFRRERCDR